MEIIKNTGIEPQRGFDYKREAGERTPVSKANERPCGGALATSSPFLPTIKKKHPSGCFFVQE